MSRFFNTAGPVNPEDHYCLPPLARIDIDRIRMLIDQEKYIALCAPRQSGKTSCLLALRDHLNREGRFQCVYANMEVAQGARENVRDALLLILREIGRSASELGDPTADALCQEVEAEVGIPVSFGIFLSRWCEGLPRPVVLLFDEFDSLVVDAYISVLRHLRAHYHDRPSRFPQAVILCGVHDIRDYRLRINEGREVIPGRSPFNIKAETRRLADFTREDVDALYRQHTDETGQLFEPGALAAAWELTRGQPWLVNALAYETCFEMPEGQDRTRPITAEMIVAAKEALIERRGTHLDHLAEKLREEHVRGVVEPMLRRLLMDPSITRDDIEYVLELGFIRHGEAGLEMANPIYREIIPPDIA